MPNKKFSAWKKCLSCLLSKRFPVLKIFQLCFYFQILTICGVRAVFIFPLRLSPQYYIPGLVDPPPSKPYSINNALKFSHSSKSAQDITNEFLRRFSQVPRKPKPTKPSKPSKPNKPGKSPPSPYTSVPQKPGIDFALPLNYEISNPSGQKSDPRLETIDEKLVLIVFKLPVRKFQEKGTRKQFSSKIRIKRQRPSLQFYERQDAEAAEVAAPSRTLSLGKKIRSWWEGGARPTSAYPKFRPTRPNRPFSGRPFTTTSNKFFFGKFLKNGSTQRPRPSRSPPTRGKSSPSTTKSPFMTFSDYTFNSPGCHPRGPKLILCSTDRIEHLSMLLEKFMHYQERNNLSPYFIDTEEEDSDSYGSYDNYPPSYRHYGYRPSGKVVGRSRKPFPVVESETPGHHPSVVVLAMNKDNEENGEEEEHHSNSHSNEGYHNKDEPKVEGSDETKDTIETVPKGEVDESTKSPRRKRNKRKLVRRVERRSKEEISSSSEEESFGGDREQLSDRYLSNKREIEDERDAEYKRLKRLLKLIKRYQELI